jgi:hypothetical protein
MSKKLSKKVAPKKNTKKKAAKKVAKKSSLKKVAKKFTKSKSEYTYNNIHNVFIINKKLIYGEIKGNQFDNFIGEIHRDESDILIYYLIIPFAIPSKLKKDLIHKYFIKFSLKKYGVLYKGKKLFDKLFTEIELQNDYIIKLNDEGKEKYYNYFTNEYHQINEVSGEIQQSFTEKEKIEKKIEELESILNYNTPKHVGDDKFIYIEGSSYKNRYIPHEPITFYLNYRIWILRKRLIEISVSDGTFPPESAAYHLNDANERIESFQSINESSEIWWNKQINKYPSFKNEHTLIRSVNFLISDLNKIFNELKKNNDFENKDIESYIFNEIENAINICEKVLLMIVENGDNDRNIELYLTKNYNSISNAFNEDVNTNDVYFSKHIIEDDIVRDEFGNVEDFKDCIAKTKYSKFYTDVSPEIAEIIFKEQNKFVYNNAHSVYIINDKLIYKNINQNFELIGNIDRNEGDIIIYYVTESKNKIYGALYNGKKLFDEKYTKIDFSDLGDEYIVVKLNGIEKHYNYIKQEFYKIKVAVGEIVDNLIYVHSENKHYSKFKLNSKIASGKNVVGFIENDIFHIIYEIHTSDGQSILGYINSDDVMLIYSPNRFYEIVKIYQFNIDLFKKSPINYFESFEEVNFISKDDIEEISNPLN